MISGVEAGERMRRHVLKRDCPCVEESGGRGDKFSVIYDCLKKKHPDFDLKDYGYSRLSRFLRSMGNISVRGNAVTLKDAAKQKTRKKNKTIECTFRGSSIVMTKNVRQNAFGIFPSAFYRTFFRSSQAS